MATTFSACLRALRHGSIISPFRRLPFTPFQRVSLSCESALRRPSPPVGFPASWQLVRQHSLASPEQQTKLQFSRASLSLSQRRHDHHHDHHDHDLSPLLHLRPHRSLKMTSSDLATYQLQLQQVEVALTADPDNQELVKLREDLSQVIKLTKDLISQQVDRNDEDQGDEDDEEQEEVEPQPGPSTSSASSSKHQFDALTPVKHWQVGEQCQALYSKDGLYYEAKIQEITTDGEVSVQFRHNGQQGVTSLGLLKVSKLGYTGSTSSASRKEKAAKDREYLKKRKAKKLERFKEMEKARQKEQNKWKNFSNKAFGKKGFVKKSIFKTPENAGGRVGVGTCGVSGQKMTEFSHANKYRRGT